MLNMHKEILTETQIKLLPLVAEFSKDFGLVGGTAIALHLGHRRSIDFDFFTTKEFVPKVFSSELSKLGSFKEEQADRGTVLGKFKGIKFSLFIYKYPLICITLL